MIRLLAWLITGVELYRQLKGTRDPSPAPTRPSSRVARFVVEHPWKALGALAMALGVGGALVVLSGLVPVRASSGHWWITEQFLQFTKTRSVSTYSLLIDAPSLDDPVLVMRGAGHFEAGCSACHGAPGRDLPVIPQAMTPKPPRLQDRVPEWSSEELFSIVKHGIKFTGMPAWPALGRDDEVWSMVAFLESLPGMSADEYRRLVYGEQPAPGLEPGADSGLDGTHPPAPVLEMCGRCHGLDGGGRELEAFPRLAGQRREYLALALQAYASGDRHSGIMQPVAKALTDETIRAVADYYAAQPWRPSRSPVDPALVARGEAIATAGIAERDVPPCRECHGPGATDRNPAFPLLAGQSPDYLALQLRLLQRDARGGSDYVRLMKTFVHQLTDEQVEATAHFFAASTPDAAPRP